MPSILSTNDFTGQYQLSITPANQTALNAFFEKIERQYLVKLLGAELYGLFYADLSGNPQTPATDIYQAIFEPLAFDDGDPYSNNGLKEVLKGFAFYHWVRDNQLYDTVAGMVSNNIENSTSQSGTTLGGQYIVNKYNEALEGYNVIQRYINLHISDYPDYNGVSIYQSAVFW